MLIPLGRLEEARRDYESALREADETLAGAQPTADLHSGIAEVLIKLGDLALAEEHLDAAAADVLLTDVLTAMAAQGRGVVMATHRLSGLGLADEVVRLEAVVASHARMPARVAARGTHAYLLAHDPAYGSAVRRD